MGWVKHLSWHVVSVMGRTRCGRLWTDTDPRSDDLPLGEKSCETCARLILHDAERA